MEPHAPRFSGALGLAPLAVPLALLVAVPTLSIAYAYAGVYSPIAGWISLVLVVGFGMALGKCVGLVGRLARCRSPRFLATLGALAGVAGLYVSWACFEYALLRRGDEPVDVALADVLTSPRAMWDVAGLIAETGWYTVGSLTPSGAVLWAFWAAEAGVVVFFAARIAGGALDDDVYCESCERWCEAEGAPIRLAVPAGPARERVVAGELDAIAELAGGTAPDEDHVRLDVLRCSRCRESGAFRLRRVATVTDDKGKTKEEVESLVDFARRPATELERLAALRGASAPKPAASA